MDNDEALAPTTYFAEWISDSSPIPEFAKIMHAKEDVEGRKADEEAAAAREAAGENRVVVARSLGFEPTTHEEIVQRAAAQMALSEKLQEREHDEYGRHESLAPEPGSEDVARDVQRHKRYLQDQVLDRRIASWRSRQHGRSLGEAWDQVLRRGPRERFERAQAEAEVEEFAIAQRMVQADREKAEANARRSARAPGHVDIITGQVYR
jgi:hypothetical protein